MSAPATPPDWEVIARYLAGESPAEEAAAVRAWLDANPADRELVDRLNGAAAIDTPADVDVEGALARVHRRMAETPGPAPRPELSLERGAGAHRPKRGAVWIAGAAAAAAIIVAAVTMNRPAETPSSGEDRSYATGVGQRDSVSLADGSRVILGPQSTLRVPADFGRESRTVTLTGDAYFDVHHDAAKPFRVRSARALIEDVGTTFVIENDQNDETSVAVMSGIVRLSADSAATESVRLEAGDRGSIDGQGRSRVARNSVHAEDSAWVRGQLSFRDAPLSRVAAAMERWYGVKISVSDTALRARHLTASFEGESVDQALRILGLTMGANIERRGDSVLVTPMRGSPTPR